MARQNERKRMEMNTWFINVYLNLSRKTSGAMIVFQ